MVEVQRDKPSNLLMGMGNRISILRIFGCLLMSLAFTAPTLLVVDAEASANTPTASVQEFGTTQLTSVGCLDDGTCIGFDNGVGGDVYELTNGSWESISNPPNDQYGLEIWPEQLSCTDGVTCTVIGNDQQSIVSVVWEDGAWQTPVIADYKAPDYDNFHFAGISCFSLGNCLAVGSIPDGNLTESFSMQETSGVWQPPVVDRNSLEQYESVSCWSNTDCEVVGFVLNSNYEGSAGSTVWSVDGGQWGSPSTIYQSGWLTSISCPVSGWCVAVGSSLLTKGGADAFPIESILSSGTWTTPVEPNLENIGLGSWYTSVSCLDEGDCLAVGVTYGEFDGFYSILQGGQLTIPAAITSLSESTLTTSDLYGSACSSNGFCVGTGRYIPQGYASCLAITVAFRTQLANTSKPTISGRASTGSTLVANPGTWTSTSTFSYQWFLNSSPISGATSNSYKVNSDDVGGYLSVQVTAVDDGQMMSAQSLTAKVTKGVFNPVLKLIHNGPVRTGVLVTADVSDVPTDAVIHVQWLLNGHLIPHATRLSLKISSAFSGYLVSFRATVSASGFTTLSKQSDAVVC